MNVPISALDILEVFEPGVAHSITGVERAIRVVELIGRAKSIAIEALEQKVLDLQVQNTALQAHNTELLIRARKAEDRVKELEPKGFPSEGPAHLQGSFPPERMICG